MMTNTKEVSLSSMERVSIEERHRILEELRYFDFSLKTERKRTPKIVADNLLQWEYLFNLGFLVSFLGFVLYLWLTVLLTSVSAAGLTLVTLLGIPVFFILRFILIPLIKEEAFSKKRHQNFIERTKVATNIYQDVVHRISKIAHKATIENLELYFEYAIEKRQDGDKKAAKALPYLSIILIVLAIIILGIPVQLIEKKFLYGTVVGVTGVLALTQQLLGFLFEFNSTEIDTYKECLLILGQAKTIAKDFTTDKELAKDFIYPQQHNQQQSLMTKLKSVKIDAPSDFDHND